MSKASAARQARGHLWARGCEGWECGQVAGLSIFPCRSPLVHGIKTDHLVSIWTPKTRTASPLFPGWRARPTREAITSRTMRWYAFFMPPIMLSRRAKGTAAQFRNYVVSRRRATQGAVLYDIDYVKWLQHNIASYSGRGAASSARDPCLGWEALTCRFRWKRFGLEPGRAQWPWPCFRATDP